MPRSVALTCPKAIPGGTHTPPKCASLIRDRAILDVKYEDVTNGDKSAAGLAIENEESTWKVWRHAKRAVKSRALKKYKEAKAETNRLIAQRVEDIKKKWQKEGKGLNEITRELNQADLDLINAPTLARDANLRAQNTIGFIKAGINGTLGPDGQGNNVHGSGVVFGQLKSHKPGFGAQIDLLLVYGSAENASMFLDKNNLGLVGPGVDTTSANKGFGRIFNANVRYLFNDPSAVDTSTYGGVMAGVYENDSRDYAGADGVGAAAQGLSKFNMLHLQVLGGHAMAGHYFNNNWGIYAAGTLGQQLGSIELFGDQPKRFAYSDAIAADAILGLHWSNNLKNSEKANTFSIQGHVGRQDEKKIGGVYVDSKFSLSSDYMLALGGRLYFSDDTKDWAIRANIARPIGKWNLMLGGSMVDRETIAPVGVVNGGHNVSGGAGGVSNQPYVTKVKELYLQLVSPDTEMGKLKLGLNFSNFDQINGDPSIMDGASGWATMFSAAWSLGHP